MERKPDNGCEIQNICCAKSGVMLRLKLVKSAEEEEQGRRELEDDYNNNNNILHGTKICLELTQNYFWSDRVLCRDSYLASVKCTEKLLKRNLRFINVVKIAKRMFPYDYLGRVELLGDRGDRKGLIRYHPDSNQPQMLALVWMDRDHRFFFCTAFGLDEGELNRRDRYRQLVLGCKHTPAKKVELVVPQPKVCEAYYNTCSAIDQHNPHRVDTLGIDKKVKTKDWSKRVNFSIFSMILVDFWQLWSRITTNIDGETTETQDEFYSYLTTELIKNKYDDRVGSNKRQCVSGSPLNRVLGLVIKW